MGKTAIIRSLAKCIGNVALHKIILKHTNKPESIKHLKDEIADYSADAFENAQMHSWSDKEKEEIKNKSLVRVKNLIKKYSDIKYEENEIGYYINETMKEMLL